MSFCSDDTEEVNDMDCKGEERVKTDFGRKMRSRMLMKHYDDLYDC